MSETHDADDGAEPAASHGYDVEELLGAIDFGSLSPTAFEEFCFDLLQASGFENVDWRKGTPKGASPADRGRDIVADWARTDVDGYRYVEHWFIDCKHYDRGVPPEALQGTITWAQAERPATVLFIASGFFSNGAKDWISDFVQKSNPPFRIRVWEMPQLRRLLSGKLDIAFRHDVATETLRRVTDILVAESELSDRLWYGRSPAADGPAPEDWAPDLVEGMRRGQREIEGKYGLDVLNEDVESDWAWGFLSGKVAAIRWVLGYDWDTLDS